MTDMSKKPDNLNTSGERVKGMADIFGWAAVRRSRDNIRAAMRDAGHNRRENDKVAAAIQAAQENSHED